MSFMQKNLRFFTSTRGKIVTLLRRESQTVEELARALDLTDNAVRAHLMVLERDGLVRQRGSRRGGGSAHAGNCSSSRDAVVYPTRNSACAPGTSRRDTQ